MKNQSFPKKGKNSNPEISEFLMKKKKLFEKSS